MMSEVFYNDKDFILNFLTKDKYRLGLNFENITKLLSMCNSVYNGVLLFFVETNFVIKQDSLTTMVSKTLNKITKDNIKKHYNNITKRDKPQDNDDNEKLISYYGDMRCYILDFLYCVSYFSKQVTRRLNDVVVLSPGVYALPFFTANVAYEHSEIDLDRFIRPVYYFPNKALIGEEREKMLNELNVSNDEIQLDNKNISSLRLLTFLPVDLLVRLFCKMQYDLKQKHNIYYLHGIPLFDKYDYFVPSLTFLNVITRHVSGYYESSKRGYAITMKDQISIPAQTKQNVLKYYRNAKMPIHLDCFGFDWNIKQQIINQRNIMLGSLSIAEELNIKDSRYFSMREMDNLIKDARSHLPEEFKEFLEKRQEEKQRMKLTSKQVRKEVEDSVSDMAKFFG